VSGSHDFVWRRGLPNALLSSEGNGSSGNRGQAQTILAHVTIGPWVFALHVFRPGSAALGRVGLAKVSGYVLTTLRSRVQGPRCAGEVGAGRLQWDPSFSFVVYDHDKPPSERG
jgi:hypothetical protein